MKLNKTLLLFAALSIMLSCSQDKIDSQPPTSQTLDDFRIPNPEYDASNLGVYKGIFTTLEGDLQGEILISLDKNRPGIAEVKLNTGEIINLVSSALNANSNEIDQLSFLSGSNNSNSISLKFTVDEDGNNPMVSDVTFNNKQGSVLVAKDLLRAPVNPVVGTYSCTNCAEVYPQYSSSAHTFSLLYAGPQNNLTITTSIIYDGIEYVSTNNMMNGCTSAGTNRVCNISGSNPIRGRSMNYSGTYQFRLTNNPPNCTYTTGNWSMDIGAVVLQGTFISNNTSPCP